MNKLVETEVKIHVPDLDAVAARLAAAGAELIAPRVFERNVRYENGDETFTPQGIVLRLRQDARVRLTYKEPGVVKGGALERFEAEVTVDDFDTMDLILRRLGFHPYIVYEKYRTTYRLGEAEIVLDEMPYGNFVEVEGPAGAIEAALGLFCHDLTFANFDGITVPAEIFQTDV